MSEKHPGVDNLVAVALGDLGPTAAATLRHLDRCSSCRASYDDFQSTIDSILPATPAMEPPAGFEIRVLARLRPSRNRPRRSIPLIAAAAAIGLILGVVGASALHNQPRPVATSGQVALLAGGTPVRTVAVSYAEGRSSVVLHVTGGQPGDHYRCRVTHANGRTAYAGDWVIPASGQAAWTVQTTDSDIRQVDLVADDGHVWPTAALP